MAGSKPRGVTYLSMGAVPVYVGYCPSEKAWIKEMKRLGVKDPPDWVTKGASGTMHTFVSEERMDTCIICVDPVKGRGVEKLGLLVHESTHVVQQIKETMGEEKWGRETEAYLMQWICQWLFGLVKAK